MFLGKMKERTAFAHSSWSPKTRLEPKRTLGAQITFSVQNHENIDRILRGYGENQLEWAKLSWFLRPHSLADRSLGDREDFVTSVPIHQSSSSGSVDDFGRLFDRARAGCSVSLGLLLTGCNRYLLLVANSSLDSDLRPKAGASDLVQDTFVEAQRDFVHFKGTSERELLAWLKEILAHRIANQVRRYNTAKRDLDREIPLAAEDGFNQLVRSEKQTGPDQAAILHDEQSRLAAAMGRLPRHLRNVIEMRTWQGQSFPEIAAKLEITSEAARKQWGRAVRKLQQELRQQP